MFVLNLPLKGPSPPSLFQVAATPPLATVAGDRCRLPMGVSAAKLSVHGPLQRFARKWSMRLVGVSTFKRG